MKNSVRQHSDLRAKLYKETVITRAAENRIMILVDFMLFA